MLLSGLFVSITTTYNHTHRIVAIPRERNGIESIQNHGNIQIIKLVY